MINKMICRRDSSLLELLQVINENAKGIAFIVDENDRLCGVLTDGDIRRLFLRGVPLQKKVSEVLTGTFVFVRSNENYAEMFKKVTDTVKIIPIVDDLFRVVDYFEYRRDIHVPIATPDLRGNEFKYLMEAFLSTWVSSSGTYINKFEKEFSEFCGSGYGVCVSNGTVALHLSLIALGIQQGDEVIVPDLTFAATINAVLHANATPVIVDVERDSWCIDPNEIAKAITPRTKAIIPVHLYGQPCNMEEIMHMARKHKLFVIEDCAEAHGAKFAGKRIGSFGDINCFSFYGNKIITTGEGRMCITGSKDLDDRMRTLRDHGMSKTKKYWHEVVGYNYRMTNLQAALGVAQLERINNILNERREIEEIYKRELVSVSNVVFQRSDLPKREKVTWLVCALLKDGHRDDYMERMKNEGIDVRPFFYPLSSMPMYKRYVFSNTVSTEISSLGINLPTIKNLDRSFFKKISHLLRS